ncbi:MAG: IPT/TIG domain-containing protein [Treponema sp.]|nr:IPT/TIG domain-containing protein [Treponema sp.]
MLVSLFSCEDKGPVILSIDPKIGTGDEILLITGTGFGEERDGAYITIGGSPPVSSAYLDWNDSYISVSFPEAGSGILYVHRNGKRSNPAVFVNRNSIPEVKQGSNGVAPLIEQVKPVSGPIGSLITIQGSGFGVTREGSGVFFALSAGTLESDDAMLGASELDYELWNDREIRVRVPDGVTSGNLEVRTKGGASTPVAFTVTGQPGVKTFGEQQRYTITYTVDVRVMNAVSPNTLYLWVPEPVSSASQRNIERLERSMLPLAEQYQGTSIFQLNDLTTDVYTGIKLSYSVDVYTVETSVSTQLVRRALGSSNMASLYTMPSTLIPSDDERIKALASAIIGREQNPYEIARRLYEWLINEGGIDRLSRPATALEALETQNADSWAASLLFCALARASGVSAVPIAGVLVNQLNQVFPHYWVEFWLEDFGWVPLDPTLGAGDIPPDFDAHDNPSTYYFGNLDNQRITFSRGLAVFSQMDPQGRITTRDRAYALQSLWEEAVGGLEDYTALWSDIIISGKYAP